MARQQRTNSSKQGGRRRRYSNDGDSREEYSSTTTTTNNGVAHTNNTTSVAAAVSSQAYSSKKSEDCKGTSPARDVGVVQNNNSTINNNNNNTTTTTSQSSSIPSSTTNSSTTSTTSKDEVIPAKLSQENSYFGLNQDEFINAFSSVIQEISSQGDMIPIEAQQKTQFHTSLPPRISLRKYLDRIINLVYMDRLVQSNPNFVISSLSIHRLLITSIMVAAKFFDDKFYSNEYYANIGGIKKEEINKLEIEFLYMINFSLHFQPPEFEQYKEEFIVAPALRERALKKRTTAVGSSKQYSVGQSHHSYGDEVSIEESCISICSEQQQYPRHSSPIH
ncbi:predicted protein [Naegleria gruberi]|uniref:Predicted protein n=1 Tax=Naegleria gruberi TaxID=5762 RepID=D2VYD4_NAEGR|nr:uncharacterized protein NAEGRDRAFT_53232 [Naegleria gruberi]EFC38187.1 predicted protein [Naegleria gruberi]|eukprot:XP_002670931.1 predicted protein [Naegleria gruberi strain NEG-M]